ncbi:MAG: methyltransferase domain-containing protein [Nanoarchaeota archaeon]
MDKTKEYYNAKAKKYEDTTKDYIRKYIQKEVELFLSLLPGKKILDLGCGPGRDSLYFKARGFNPMGVDFSPEMIKLCKQKNLEAYEMDIRKLNFPLESFDGIWAYTLLLHLKKEELPKTLINLEKILRQKGAIFIAMKEGNFEEYQEGGRFVSLYTDAELRDTLSQRFKIHSFSKISLKNRIHKKEEATYLHYLCTLKTTNL